MKAAWRVHFATGAELTDNDLYRVRERITELLQPLADEFLADLTVSGDYHVPGPAAVNPALPEPGPDTVDYSRKGGEPVL